MHNNVNKNNKKVLKTILVNFFLVEDVSKLVTNQQLVSNQQ